MVTFTPFNMKFISLILIAVASTALVGCTNFSPYKGSYYSLSGEKTMELEAGGTGFTIAGEKKFPLTWEDPITNRETGLKDNTGYDYCYITYENSDKTQAFFGGGLLKSEAVN